MFRNIKKEKELIDREIKLYRHERLVEIDKYISDYKEERNSEIQEMGKLCHKQMAQYEHEFHSTKEVRGIELAKLEAKVESLQEVVKAREEVIKADNNLLQSKDAEIKRLNDIIALLINKQPQHTTTIQQLK